MDATTVQKIRNGTEEEIIQLLGDWTQKVGSHNTAKCLLEGLKEFM
jgi:hypothetical protein